MSYIAGPYTASLNALALGETADGYRTDHQFFKRLITGDAYGEAPQDAVYRGAEFGIAYTLNEYDAAAAQLAFWPYSATLYDMGQVGRTDVGSGIVQPLILTAVAGTPATPATITFPRTILQEGFPVEMLYGPDLREIPIRQRIYPTAGVGGTMT